MLSQRTLLCLGLLSAVLGKTNPDQASSSSKPPMAKSRYWGSELAALQAQLEARMQARTTRRLRGSHATSTTSEAPMTTTESMLMARIVDLQREMCADPKRQSRSFCKQFADEAAVNVLETTTTTTAHPEVAAAQARLESQDFRLHLEKVRRQANSRRATLAAKGALLKNNLAALAERHAAWDRDLAARAASLGREICAEPKRQVYEACKPFLKDAVAIARRLAVAEVPHQAWGQSTATQVTDVQEVTPWVVTALRAAQLMFNVCMVCFALLWYRKYEMMKKAQLQAVPLLAC